MAKMLNVTQIVSSTFLRNIVTHLLLQLNSIENTRREFNGKNLQSKHFQVRIAHKMGDEAAQDIAMCHKENVAAFF